MNAPLTPPVSDAIRRALANVSLEDKYTLERGRVYISGTPSDPVTVFTSDPPLPQEEIVALLGTGATTEELRTAMVHYRALFDALLEPSPQTAAAARQ